MEKGKRWRPDGGVLRAAAVSLGTYLLLLALAAYLTLSGRVGEAHMQGAARLCAAVATFAGAAFSVRGGVSSAFLTAALFGGTVLLLGAFSGGVNAPDALRFLLSLLLGALAALPLRRRSRRRGRRRTPPRRST